MIIDPSLASRSNHPVLTPPDSIPLLNSFSPLLSHILPSPLDQPPQPLSPQTIHKLHHLTNLPCFLSLPFLEFKHEHIFPLIPPFLPTHPVIHPLFPKLRHRSRVYADFIPPFIKRDITCSDGKRTQNLREGGDVGSKGCGRKGMHVHGGREKMVGAGGCAEGGEELRVEGREGGNEGEGCLFLVGGHCCGA